MHDIVAKHNRHQPFLLKVPFIYIDDISDISLSLHYQHACFYMFSISKWHEIDKVKVQRRSRE